jgi:lysophospholipase L1-like esterase
MTSFTTEQMKRVIRFFHPQKKYPFLPGIHSDETQAMMYGLDLDIYKSIKYGFIDNAKSAAIDLLQDSDFMKDLLSLPLSSGARVVVIGDSLTDDYQSWFEIISQAFSIARPNDDIEFINTTTSGDTTTQMLGTVVHACNKKPDLLICLIGTNDSRTQVNGGEAKPCIGIQESQDNIDAIANYAKEHCDAPLVWIAPPGVNEERIKNDWFIRSFFAFWENQRIQDLSGYIVKKQRYTIDLRAVFNSNTVEDLFLEDGLHWSLDGQKVAAKSIMKELSHILQTVYVTESA